MPSAHAEAFATVGGMTSVSSHYLTFGRDKLVPPVPTPSIQITIPET
jgi:hypothetical protein